MLAASPAWADLRSAGIRRAVHELGDARTDDMDAAVEAALELESPPDMPGLDAPLILAIAWSESRFRVDAGPLCGVMQVSPGDMEEPRRRCREWRHSVRAGIEIGVREVRKILTDIRRVRGSLDRALEYRACGGKAFTHRCRKGWWLVAVKRIAARLRAPPYRMEKTDATVHGVQ